MKDNRLQCFYVGDVEDKQPYVNVAPDPNSVATQLPVYLRRRSTDEQLPILYFILYCIVVCFFSCFKVFGKIVGKQDEILCRYCW